MRSLMTCLFTIALVAVAACGDDTAGGQPPGDDDGTPPPAELSCANYCAAIEANCEEGNQQYSSTSNCMASCALFAQGTADDMGGNTLGCRFNHANLAAEDPVVHCKHAGPGGNGVCGSNCEGFCAVAVGACKDQAVKPYADEGVCKQECANFATTPEYSASVTSGNSLSCRIYHAQFASTLPDTHCAHVTPISVTCM